MLGVIDLIYEATLSPDSWPVVVERIVDVVGGSYGMFQLRDRQSQAITLNEEARVNPEAMADYEAYYYKTDLWLQKALTLGRTLVTNGHDLVPIETLRASEFYNDFILPYEGSRILSVVPVCTDETLAYLSIFRSEQKEDFDEEALRFMHLLSPHLNRACRIAMKFAACHAKKQGPTKLLIGCPSA